MSCTLQELQALNFVFFNAPCWVLPSAPCSHSEIPPGRGECLWGAAQAFLDQVPLLPGLGPSQQESQDNAFRLLLLLLKLENLIFLLNISFTVLSRQIHT